MENFNWFPGHMTKAIRAMEEDLKLVDLIIELVDARIPVSGRNPEIDRMASGKARMLLFTKTDLADPAVTKAWERYFQQSYAAVVPMDLVHDKGFSKIYDAAKSLMKDKQQLQRQKGMKEKPIKLMITGIPNVGKSTLINLMAGRAEAAKTGDLSGVAELMITPEDNAFLTQQTRIALRNCGIIDP